MLIVDADLRRASLAKVLGVHRSPGLCEVLRGTVPLEEALVRTEQLPNLYVLPAGDSEPGSVELLASDRWRALIDVFRKQFGFVVLDAPPVAAVADYDLLQLASDGVILVVRQDYTNRQLCQRALDTVPKEKQLGIILNCAQEWFLWKTHSYYYYSSEAKS